MTTWTTEDRQNASPPHIVDSGASPRTLSDFIAQEQRLEMLREHIQKLYEKINRLRDENARLKQQIENFMDGRC